MTETSKKNQDGFTLLEMLLTTGVVAISLLVITNVLEDSARNATYTVNATYMESVMEYANDAVDTLDGFNAMYAAALSAPPNYTVEVSIFNSTVGIPNILPFTLASGDGTANIPPNPSLGALAAGQFSEVAPMGTQVTALYSILDNPLIATDERRLAVIIATLNPMAEQDLRPAALSIGVGGGYISAVPPTVAGICLVIGCNETVRSAFGTWSLDATTLAGTRWRTAFDTAPPVAGQRGYLFSFRFVAESDIAGDYLYRTPQPANPELNTMFVDIDMAGNDIVGVDNLQVNTDFQARSDIHVQGSAHFDGNFQGLGADVTVNGTVDAGALSVSQTYTDSPSNFTAPTRNNVVVEGDLDTGSSNVSETITAPSAVLGTLQSPAIRATDTTVNGALDVTSPASGIFSTDVLTNQLNVANGTRTGSIETSSVNAIGTVGTLNVINTGNNTIGTVNTPIVDFSASGSLTINQLEQCLSGC